MEGTVINISYYINQIEQLQKEQDAIYHDAAVKCGLSDTAMWILYTVSGQEREYTQKELCRQCFFAKQTVNTTIAGLVKNGYVMLEPIPGVRNQKKIVLTESGRRLAERTTDHVREAELRAYGKLTEKELADYLETTSKLSAYLRDEMKNIITKGVSD